MAGPLSAAAVLAAGFEDDPVLAWAFEDPGRRDKLEALFTVVGERGVVREGDGVAAIWLPPQAPVDEDGDQLAALMPMATAGDWERLAVLGEVMSAAHPTEPHWYLAAIATLPEHRSRGRGSALLAESLLTVDTDRMPAYLESSNPRNITLYERHGFEITGRIDIDDGVFMTPMWRP